MIEIKVGQYWRENDDHIYYIEKDIGCDGYTCSNIIMGYRINLYGSSIKKFCKQIKGYGTPLWKVINDKS